ncbi:dTMP kinase [Terrihabitans rhizophilus]|jgi:dTMP kinase|uniref:Thymidylate kinase n=1 Tax=Terrihabitans rhizophilus TaxID=3092662 RepID=A0ABU4RKK8_9HYPH|nr:dTMP kinase [Terrihabitans sp. PJ23]MDX6805347.1 dTMP kinase [Terrihabitans sp. PJ23]
MARRFITFEGGEGTGKSTQARLLAERLRALGEDVVATREPGGSPEAERLRDLILSGRAKNLGAFAETALFSAARLDHLRSTIRPVLARGGWVICDRFLDSTRAYQGALGNLDPRVLRALERVVVEDTVPGLTLLLDVPAEIGLERARQRSQSAPDRFEAEAIGYHRSLRQAFLDIAHQEPQRVRVVDARPAPDEVAEQVWATTAETFALAAALHG